MSQKAVFLDRDDTLIHDRHYIKDPNLVQLFEDTIPSLKRLKASGFLCIVITNQSGIGRGYLTLDDFEAVETKFHELLKQHNIQLDGSYFCPHHPTEAIPPYNQACDCRKPEPGMILQAIQHFKIDCEQSFMIGDKISDVEAGNRANCQSILLNRKKHIPCSDATLTVQTLQQATDYILSV